MASTVANKVVRFGMVEFPAALKCSSSKQDVKLDRAHRVESGWERIERRDRGTVTDSHLSSDEITYGIWVDDDIFRPIAPESLEAIRALGRTERVGRELRDLTAIEIEEFVPLAQLRPYFERSENSYFLVPQRGGIGAKPMKLLVEAMAAEKLAGTFKFVVKADGRQKLGVLHVADDGGLHVNVLAYAGDFAQADESAEALGKMAKPERRVLDQARALIRELTVPIGDSLVTTARDTAVDAKQVAIDRALEGKKVVRPKVAPEATAAVVDDLLEKLRASTAQAGKRKRKKVAA